MGLQKKESFSLKDLLYGMMLPSGNDAAIAIAISLYGSIDSFAKRMNEKAREIGMTHSHFVNPNGLHNEKHYSTVDLLNTFEMKCFYTKDGSIYLSMNNNVIKIKQ